MIALLCPGQGSQTPGMLNSWLEEPGIPELLDALSDSSGIDLRHAGTEADAQTIRDTAIAQPLIVATSLISLKVLTDQLSAAAPNLADLTSWSDFVGGHSVGEYAATAISGVLSDADAMKLVAIRGQAMAQAAGAEPSAMAAVLGGDRDAVANHLASLDLVGANFNGGGQIVAAGSTAAIEALKANPLEKTRVIELKVAGAFHTQFMAPALEAVKAAAADLNPSSARLKQLTNHDGTTLQEGPAILSTMVDQITQPVRWDLCQEALADSGVKLTIELAPGGVLAGLAKRTIKPAKHLAIKSPADIEQAVAAIIEQKG